MKTWEKEKDAGDLYFAQQCADGPSLNSLNMQEHILTENKQKIVGMMFGNREIKPLQFADGWCIFREKTSCEL